MPARGIALGTALVALGLGAPAGPAEALPPGFDKVVVAAGLAQPTAFAFKGDKIFITEKETGRVQVVRSDGALRSAPYATLSVTADSERGLLGIALDPDFATNRYVYVYYTTGPGAPGYTGTPVNRVSRLTSMNGVGSDETVILDNIPSDAGNHNGGDIQFGFDGKLYVAVGDGGEFHADAQTLDNLRGKILRVEPDGRVPEDNPHRAEPGSRRCAKPGGVPPGNGPCREIYARGLRNPFRFSLRQATGSYLVADVGENTWEELDVLVPGGNYGWPEVEGPCPYPGNPGCDPVATPYPPQYQQPIHVYPHGGVGEAGRTIIAGAFAERGSNYPPPYAGAYFYGDYAVGWIHVLTMDATNAVTGQLDFANPGGPVSFRNGPDGNIYVLSIHKGKLFKYVYTPP